MTDLMEYLLDQLSPVFRNCPVHPEIRMKRKVFDKELFMYEYHCSKCNTWYSNIVLNQMELEE